jgi:hypothetical protein
VTDCIWNYLARWGDDCRELRVHKICSGWVELYAWIDCFGPLKPPIVSKANEPNKAREVPDNHKEAWADGPLKIKPLPP